MERLAGSGTFLVRVVADVVVFTSANNVLVFMSTCYSAARRWGRLCPTVHAVSSSAFCGCYDNSGAAIMEGLAGSCTFLVKVVADVVVFTSANNVSVFMSTCYSATRRWGRLCPILAKEPCPCRGASSYHTLICCTDCYNTVRSISNGPANQRAYINEL